MHISFAVFADAANLSQDGKLNVLGIFDALHVAGFPAVHPRANFVLRFKGSREDVGKHTLTFRWVNPLGSELWQSAGELQLDGGGGQPPILDIGVEMDMPVIVVVDLPIDGPGQYSMHVDLDRVPVSKVSIVVGGPIGVMPKPKLGLVS